MGSQTPSMALAAATDLERLVRREHASPHDILGAHATDGGVVDPRVPPRRRRPYGDPGER